MTWEEVLVALIGSLIWPATLIFGLLLFKKPLARLIERATTARWGTAELNFGADANDLVNRTERLLRLDASDTPASDLSNPEPEPVWKDLPYRSSRLLAAAREIENIVPMAAVALGRSALEATLTESLPLPDGGRRRTLQKSISEAGRTLGSAWEEAAREAVLLGNDAAHGEAENISADAAANYLASIENICGFAETVLDQRYGD